MKVIARPGETADKVLRQYRRKFPRPKGHGTCRYVKKATKRKLDKQAAVRRTIKRLVRDPLNAVVGRVKVGKTVIVFSNRRSN